MAADVKEKSLLSYISARETTGYRIRVDNDKIFAQLF